jgi:hypothetical protein
LYNTGQGILTNSTFSANRANGDGGGIWNGSGVATWLDASNITVALNIADDNNNDSGTGGGIYNSGSANFVVRNSIIASNIDKSSIDTDCYGLFNSGGYNLIGHEQFCSGFIQTGDQDGGANGFIDPKLGPLQKNGGYSATHALAADSPAVDAGNTGGCEDKYGQTFSYDQRVFDRHADGGKGFGARCDIGAFEYGSHFITPTPNPCSQKPGAAALTTPANGGQTHQTKVVLDWDDVNCATKYKVVVKQDSKKGLKVFGISVTASFTKSTKLAIGHTYFWKVNACNAAGCTRSKWSTFQVTQ